MLGKVVMMTLRWRYITWVLVYGVYAHAGERITSFVSDITVHQDASLRVTEQITVISKGQDIRHGIVREFPTTYQDDHGLWYVVDFDLREVTHNGQTAPFTVVSVSNGKKIYIGDKYTEIEPGEHTYTLSYTVNRQIGFFPTHDELYWNVTGTGWRLPISHVEAHVHLPPTVVKDITVDGYTGYQNETHNEYKYTISGNTITVMTTQPLKKYQGLTIAVSFPKGFVIEPSILQKLYWILRDNLLFVITLLVFLVLCALLVARFVLVRRKNAPGVIIPLFYPPTGMTPSELRLMTKLEFDDTCLAADIVDLAVRDFIVIDYKPNKLFGGTYALELKNKMVPLEQQGTTSYDTVLLRTLFAKEHKVVISNDYVLEFQHAHSACKTHSKSKNDYLAEFTGLFYSIAWISVAYVIAVIVIGTLSGGFHASIVVAIFMIAGVSLQRKWYRIYTPQGRKLQDAIDGFKLYLMTAECERMRVIGTPPTKTPQLYEKYLPYAIALGVEKQWTQQFASVFAELACQGHPYTPVWYTGSPFQADRFATPFASSFSQAVVAASNPPGSTSGSGGSGRSGGGGGGGGGGGW